MSETLLETITGELAAILAGILTLVATQVAAMLTSRKHANPPLGHVTAEGELREENPGDGSH